MKSINNNILWTTAFTKNKSINSIQSKLFPRDNNTGKMTILFEHFDTVKLNNFFQHVTLYCINTLTSYMSRVEKSC